METLPKPNGLPPNQTNDPSIPPGEAFEHLLDQPFEVDQMEDQGSVLPAAASIRAIHAAPEVWCGREGELAQAVAAFEITPAEGQALGVMVAGLGAGGGLGKTAFARKLAERLADRFSQAVVEIDLQGTAYLMQPALKPEEAMRRILAHFHPRQRLPGNPAELRALYVKTLRSQPALLLLDNAHDMAQAGPLLPPYPSAVIITTSAHFDLEEASMQTIWLDRLPPAEAVELLKRSSPRLAGSAHGALLNLAQAGGNLPMALRQVALFYESQPDWDANQVELYLRQTRSGLAALRHLKDPDLDALCALELTYRNTAPTLRICFRLLGVLPAPFDLGAAQALWQGVPKMPGDPAQALELLVKTGLVEYQAESGLFTLHDVARLYALTLLVENKDEARLALSRFVAYYMERGEQIEASFRQGGEAILQALQECQVTWPHLQAAWKRIARDESGWPLMRDALEWINRFPRTLTNIVEIYLPPDIRTTILERAAAAAQHLNDRQGEANHRGALGRAYADLGDVTRMIECYHRQLVIAREAGNSLMEGSALGSLGTAYAALGESYKAAEYYGLAMEVSRSLNVPTTPMPGPIILPDAEIKSGLGSERAELEFLRRQLVAERMSGERAKEAVTLGKLAGLHRKLGEQRQAIAVLDQQRAILSQLEDRAGEYMALLHMGSAYLETGDGQKAYEYYHQALKLSRQLNDRTGTATCLANVGLAYEAMKVHDRALLCWKQALAIYSAANDPRAQRVQALLEQAERKSAAGQGVVKKVTGSLRRMLKR